MPDAAKRYSLKDVDRAGKILCNGTSSVEGFVEALEVFKNWEDCHSYPLTCVYESLTGWAKDVSWSINVVQRRKRLDAVIAKLRREPTMKLSRIQDIAGCRIIMPRVQGIEEFIGRCKEGLLDHELYRSYDYISTPKESGYRGVHLVYRFKSNEPSFNRRFIEIQFRSHYQHVWATAVEIVDLFTKQSLKSGEGDPNWLRFFALMGSAFAQIERLPLVPGTPTGDYGKNMQNELRKYAALLNVQTQLIAFGSLSNSISSDMSKSSGQSGFSGYSGLLGRPAYFVMELNADLRGIQVKGYQEDEIQQAARHVASAERTNPNTVLVAASDVRRLKEAYPNWIIDTSEFLNALKYTLTTEFW